ncbi:hypothetical protein Nepgr_018190 [Nepenthes gracilis]|uniref:DYW domain-containing protein n=1 Tax=Nepenthes gracilis TaxID=150966 RepID=A0AAD3XTT1_NEPGR|nr:hypothetical protein Nepgr_018190 [Nepenthes gracilis]
MAAALVHTHLCVSKISKRASITTAELIYRERQGLTKLRHSNSAAQFRKCRKAFKTLANPGSLSLTRALVTFVEAGYLEDAFHLFEKMPHSDTFVWNVLIKGLVTNGFYEEAIDIYYRMTFAGIRADNFTYPFVIKACAGLSSLFEGQKVHSKLVKTGLDVDVYTSNSLISTYAKLGRIEFAERLFVEMEFRDLVSWNSMISGYISAGDGWNSLICFREMQLFGMTPDRFSIISALGACSLECLLQKGKEIHCLIIKNEFEMDSMIQTSAIDMYSKCGRVDYAEKFFDCIPQRNIGAWNAMIGGYSLNNHPLQSLACLKKMNMASNLVSDTVTLINVLPACAQLGALLQGKSVHGVAIRKGFLPHLALETALINMYGECGRLNISELVFGQMTDKSLISWNTMVAAYVKNECHQEALKLFQNLLNANLGPDAVTIASILPSYAEVGSVREGKQIHGYVAKSGAGSSTYISNAMVYMYAKCGDLTNSQKYFDGLIFKDVVSWNTIIMANALHGFGEESLRFFSEMQAKGVKPNASTFVSLLSSCSITGMFDEGWKYFHSMIWEFRIDPQIEHYGCMIDLLGRKGNTHFAQHLIEEMPLAPTARIWGSLLTAARRNGDIALAEHASAHILKLRHDNTGCYALLSSMYAEAGRWAEAECVKHNMRKEGFEKTAGCSVVEIDGNICRFFNGDRSHEETEKIYDALSVISGKITKFRQQESVGKRANSPEFHSVRLAITSGLISTAPGSPILVRKNIRICENCHDAAKKISDISRREIVVGDSKIFHHFKCGRCTCRDYW